MTARNLLYLFDLVYLAALAVWIGGAITFTFVLGPRLLQTVRTDAARTLLRAVYTRYYIGGAISGAVALASFVAGPLCFQEYRRAMVGVQAVAIIAVTLLMLYGGNVLVRPICAVGRDDTAIPGQFGYLQRRGVWLDLAVLTVGTLLLVAHVVRPAPSTAGIIELTPSERGPYDEAVNRAIEDAEIKYGFRPPRREELGKTAATDQRIDEEAVRELESYYAKRRLRDQLRAKNAGAKGTPP